MKLGILCVAYYNTGTYGSPVWVPVVCISDFSVEAPWDFAEGSTRASRIKTWAKTMIDLNITGKVRADDTEVTYLKLLGQNFLDAGLDMMILNGPSTETGVTGYRADFLVAFGKSDQNLGVMVFDEISLKPSVSANLPQKVLVTAGLPVFSAPVV